MLLSATRCLLTYVVFPFVFPLIGVASGIHSTLGLTFGAIAIVANAYSINRFWTADHRFKVPVCALNVAIIVGMLILTAQDASRLLA